MDIKELLDERFDYNYALANRLLMPNKYVTFKDIREHSILPLMDTAIDFYLVIVWEYFAFNITACILLFFIIKVWIIKKLNDHYDNLYLLSMCFYVVHD